VTGKAELAVDPGPAVPGVHALEWEAVIHLVDFHAVEHAEEIKVPPGAAELAVGGDLQSDLLLLSDDLLNFAVFDLLELSVADLALSVRQYATGCRPRRRERADYFWASMSSSFEFGRNQAGAARFVNSNVPAWHKMDEVPMICRKNIAPCFGG